MNQVNKLNKLNLMSHVNHLTEPVKAVEVSGIKVEQVNQGEPVHVEQARELN